MQGALFLRIVHICDAEYAIQTYVQTLEANGSVPGLSFPNDYGPLRMMTLGQLDSLTRRLLNNTRTQQGLQQDSISDQITKTTVTVTRGNLVTCAHEAG